MNRLIIARYAESLDWILRIPESFEVVVVNKGTPVTGEALRQRARIVQRANRGREGETYLSQIEATLTATNRPIDSSGFTVFAQGDPFEHSPDFIGLLENAAAWQDVQPLSWRWRREKDIPPAAILARETGGFVGGLRVRPERFSLGSWAPIGFDDPGTQWLNSTYRGLHGLPAGTNIAAHFLDLCGLPDLAADAARHRLGTFAYGALFAVRTALLERVRPGAIALLGQAANGHAVYGYVLERLWLHLFGAPFCLELELSAASCVVPPHARGTPVIVPPESRAALHGRRARRLVGRVRRLVVGA
jgi:hypothetical protein